jgi:hypothetical protein
MAAALLGQRPMIQLEAALGVEVCNHCTRKMDWHTVLAGPIVRRVDALSASVWIAVSESCRVTLRVWSGLESAATSRTPIFEGSRTTRRVGDQLHIAVVTAPGQYQPGTLYSYDLELNAGGDATTLDDLELLADGTFDGKRHRALGYEPGMLPSFAMSPLELTDLRILHCSCRLADTPLQDGMVWIDDLIADGRTSATRRPHQLVMSGDQIYSDEIGAVFLALATDLINPLIGVRRDSDDELRPKEEVPAAGRKWPCDRARFPPGWRRALVVNEARLTTIEGNSHALSLAEYCGCYLLAWSNTLWPQEYPAAETFTSPLPPVDGRPANVTMPDGFENEFPKKYAEWVKELNRLRDGLPFVRRAMANIATYMIMDDHDVTDDWNLTELWRNRVYSTELGRTIVRNGTMSYAFFQGWGNDPAAFETGANKALLDEIENICPENADTYPDAGAAARIDELIGSTGSESQIRWHYQVDGARHRLVAIDNRTRRAFKGRVTPPQNIMPTRLEDQIPEGPLPAGLEALVLVMPLPVFGPPVIDELLGSLFYRVGDLVTYFTQRNPGNTNQPGTWPDAVESWPYSPEAFEALLNWLEPYKRVVFLSGDVHYSVAQGMTFWKARPTSGDPEPPARFAQLICSAVKTQFQPEVISVGRVLGLAQRVMRARIAMERLAYQEPDPSPVRLPPGQTIPRALRRRLQERPVLLPTEGWPDGTTETRPFDWAWRLDEVTRDERKDEERPAPSRVFPLDPANPTADVAKDLPGYRRVAARQVRQLDQTNYARQIVFANTIAVVRFTRDGTGLAVHQDLLATHPLSPTPDTPEVYTIHSISLEPTPGDVPPSLS